MSAAIMFGRSAFVCFCLRQVVVLWEAGSAAIMIGRSAFVCFALVKLSRYGVPFQQR